MTDIFTEIDEELRKERAQKLWDRYGNFLIAGAVAIVIATAAWQGWNLWQDRKAAEAGDKIFAALRTAETDKDAGRAELEALLSGAPSGYQGLLKFRLAALDAAAGKTEEALKAYDALSRDQSIADYWRDLARVRAAYLVVDTEEPAAIEQRLSGLSAAGSPWRASVLELRALAAWRAGDYVAAKTLVDEIAADPAVPAPLSKRMSTLAAVLKGMESAAPAQTK